MKKSDILKNYQI